MQRRKFVTGLGALATGSAAAVGTGAFSSVTANRNVDLRVATDENAYLRLSPNSEYTYQNDEGQLAFDLTAANSTSGEGDGLNGTADTVISDAFTIENQGTQPVYVWIASYDHDAAGNRSVEMVTKGKDLTFPDPNIQQKNGDNSVSGEDTSGGFIQLTVGESVNVDMIFHVGGGGPRQWEGKAWQFRADETAPSSADAWTDNSLPSHSDTQTV